MAAHPYEIKGLAPHVTLMEFQENAIVRLYENEQKSPYSSLLTFPCGQGKTLTALSHARNKQRMEEIMFAKRDSSERTVPLTVVVVPLIASITWATELRTKFSPPIPHFVITGSTKERDKITIGDIEHCEVIIINKELLTKSHMEAIKKRTSILEYSISMLQTQYPSTVDTKRLTRPEREHYFVMRERIALYEEYLSEHKRSPKIRNPIPFSELASMEGYDSMCLFVDAIYYYKDIDRIIVDEAHDARTKDGNYYNALIDLERTENNLAFLLMTATPCNNGIGDLVSEFRIAGIKPNGGWKKLLSHNESAAEFLSKCCSIYNVSSPLEEQRKIKETYRPIYIYVYCDFMTAEEREIYTKSYQIWQNRYSGDNKISDNVLTAITRLRQVCDSIYEVPTSETDTKLVVRDPPGFSTKLAMVLEYLRVRVIPNREKAVIFSHFKQTIKSLQSMIEPFCKVFVITGEISILERSEILNAIQKHHGSAVLICTAKLGTGINMHFANHCLKLHTWWNPMTNKQCDGRLERFEQRKSIYIVEFIIKNSVQESIWLVSCIKNVINDLVVEKNEVTAKMLEAITIRAAINDVKSQDVFIGPVFRGDNEHILRIYNKANNNEDNFFEPSCVDSIQRIMEKSGARIINVPSQFKDLPPTVPIKFSHITLRPKALENPHVPSADHQRQTKRRMADRETMEREREENRIAKKRYEDAERRKIANKPVRFTKRLDEAESLTSQFVLPEENSSFRTNSLEKISKASSVLTQCLSSI